MSEEKTIYWISQIGGWLGFILLILFQNFLQNNINPGIIKVLVVNFTIGIVLSHLMRWCILRLNWLKFSIYKAFPRVIIISVVFGILASLLYAVISDFFFKDIRPILVYPYTLLLQFFISYPPVFLFWNLLYFAAYYLKNYEREEVKNLRLKAAMNEVELTNLKSQLNPHFMFNAMNSIRALVDENPEQAKVSITQLSNMLRNTLVLGKKKVISLDDEIKVVENYLDLESVRYEERLRVEYDIDPDVRRIKIPPLMIQTLVENGIKHGISSLPQGGLLRVSAGYEGEKVIIKVENSGFYDPKKKVETGIGLNNTRKRLRLMYGEKARLRIMNEKGNVLSIIEIPKL